MTNKKDCENCKKNILFNELQVQNDFLKKEIEEQAEVIRKLRKELAK